MRFLFALSLGLGACADYGPPPPPFDAAVPLDQAASDGTMVIDVDAGAGGDLTPGASIDLAQRDATSPDLAGADLKAAATCATVSCTAGALGDTLCKTSCATLTATCLGNPAHCQP